MVRSEALRQYFLQAENAILSSIESLVELETPSTDVGQLDSCAEYLRSLFEPIVDQAEIIRVPNGGNHVRVQLHAKSPKLPPILVLTHFDTVWPVGTLERMPFRQDEDGKTYGPAIFDMKSSIAMMEHILRAFKDLNLEPNRHVVLLATADEEVGSVTSRSLIEHEAKAANCVLVPEPPLSGGVIKTARKGSRMMDIHIDGIPAHSGLEIEKGVSAIEEAAHQVLTLQAMTNLEAGLTVNTGIIQGGTNSNVVAPHVDMQVDVRAWTREDLASAVTRIRNLSTKLQGTSMQVGSKRGRPPLEESVTLPVFEKAREIASRLGIDLARGRTGGGSDGNLTGAIGVPTLDGLGVPGAGAHAIHEHIETDQLIPRTWLISELILNLVVDN